MSSASEQHAAAAASSGVDPMGNVSSEQTQQAGSKKKRNLPGTPAPDAEVIALSPRTLMATNRFVCEVCGKGFQRDQNLQLHRRGHNLPWRLKQREEQECKKRVYVCPEVSCVHHDPSRALGDLTGIKKHFFRKHGDKKWKCEKCSKRYAVQSDWKAHQKVCGTREYRCDCGTLFSRRDSFITHRAFCDALAEETAKVSAIHPVENQLQCIEPDQDGQARRTTSGMEASSPSLSSYTSSALDMPVSSTPSTRLQSGVEESGMDSLSAKHESELKAYRRTKGPALSLHLGTGPGPGPPGVSVERMGSFPLADNRFTITSEEDVVGSGFDGGAQWSSSSSGLGMFASMLESESEPWKEFSSTIGATDPWFGQSLNMGGLPTSNSIAGTYSMPTLDPLLKNSTHSQFAPPSSENISNLSFLGNGYLPTRPSSYLVPRHTGTAQLPATALLQKAALMGATSSTSSSLFHSFGGDSRFASTKEQRDQHLSVCSTALSASNWPLTSKEKLVLQGNSHGYGERVEGSVYPALYGRQGTVQEFLNALCSSGGASVFQASTHSAGDKPSEVSSSTGRDHQLTGLANQYFEGSMCQVDGSTLAGLNSSAQAEKPDGGQTTLDFLGVGGMARAAAGMVRTLSQREIASITTLSAGINGPESAATTKSNLAG